MRKAKEEAAQAAKEAALAKAWLGIGGAGKRLSSLLGVLCLSANRVV